jgi:ABC-2 type transport system permease protein
MITKGFLSILKLDLNQSIRTKGFWIYSILFGAFVAYMFMSGITESQIIGFVGLGRLLVTFMQVCIVIIPIYVLITVVRSIVGDKENNVMEYMLSLPVSFNNFFWGKFFAKFIVIYTPLLLSLILSIVWGSFLSLKVPWEFFWLYSGLLAAMVFCFLGIGMFISVYTRSQDLAISTAFVIWLVLVAFLDLLLMGMMLKLRVNPDVVITLGMLNPLQVFRVGVLVLFDPKLTTMGPAAYYILDTVSRGVFITFSIIYPTLLGLLFALFGARRFRNKDVV